MSQFDETTHLERLMDSGLCVADPAFPDTVYWRSSANMSILSENKVDTPFPCAIIGQVVPDTHYGLVGDFNPDGRFKNKLVDVKSILTIKSPSFNLLSKNFEESITALKAIENEATTETDVNSFIGTGGTGNILKFATPFFEKRGKYESLAPEELNSFDSWPIPSDLKAEFTSLKSSHRFHPVKVYDQHQQLVSPSETNTKLDHALVQVLFNIKHFHIVKDKKDTFRAEATQVQILHESPTSSYVTSLQHNLTAGHFVDLTSVGKRRATSPARTTLASTSSNGPPSKKNKEDEDKDKTNRDATVG
ncbi:hypothetical protein BDN72DRAFT_252620 [Pluteus cervinus]|uniref:Uncharacterized protein n=1 Tax=Pluteus cervinus TaxID=181527 RepID=A0ACD3AIU6_9AGAR|nr:hypothetical protein BDN72DRAFT_252620 [Pluteus cervinus]